MSDSIYYNGLSDLHATVLFRPKSLGLNVFFRPKSLGLNIVSFLWSTNVSNEYKCQIPFITITYQTCMLITKCLICFSDPNLLGLICFSDRNFLGLISFSDPNLLGWIWLALHTHITLPGQIPFFEMAYLNYLTKRLHITLPGQIPFYEMAYFYSLVLILILISIKTRSDNIFGQKPPHPPTHPPPPTGNSTLLNIAQTNHIPG